MLESLLEKIVESILLNQNFKTARFSTVAFIDDTVGINFRNLVFLLEIYLSINLLKRGKGF
jgi:hypothetical protein